MRSALTDHALDPTRYLGAGGPPVYQPLYLNDVGPSTRDRIRDLYATAAELRAARRAAHERIGVIVRTRRAIGRRLIGLGVSLSGQHA